MPRPKLVCIRPPGVQSGRTRGSMSSFNRTTGAFALFCACPCAAPNTAAFAMGQVGLRPPRLVRVSPARSSSSVLGMRARAIKGGCDYGKRSTQGFGTDRAPAAILGAREELSAIWKLFSRASRRMRSQPCTGISEQSVQSSAGLCCLGSARSRAGTVAGIIPILAQILTENGKPRIQPAWASVALGIAAAFVLLDRFFGFSSVLCHLQIVRAALVPQTIHEFTSSPRMPYAGHHPMAAIH